MNKFTSKITLILISILGINILPIMPAQSHPFSGMGNELMSQTRQETSVNVDFNNLNQPHILRISSENNVYLTGSIQLNGKNIADLAGNSQEINLSSYLQRGVNTIDVLAQYDPTYATIKVEFFAPGTTVSQQASGKGELKQKITVRVE